MRVAATRDVSLRPAARWTALARHPRLLWALEGVGVADAVVALLFVSVLWLPPLVENKAYLPALALLALYAAYRAIRERRFPPVPLFLVAYVAVYALATVYAGPLHLGSLRHGYFVRPVTAVAVATVITTSRQRLRVLALIVLFGLSQAAITAVQAIENVVRYGRHATHTASVDAVTGSLATPSEPHQAGTVTLIALIAAAIVAAAWLWGALRPSVAIVACAALAAVGAFSATRAAPPFMVVLAAGLIAAALVFASRGPSPSRVVALGIAAIAVAGAVGVSMVGLYADVYTGAVSKEQSGTFAGPPITPSGGKGVRGHKIRLYGPELRPGRITQLRLAVRLSFRDGAGVALLGRGPGSSDFGTARYPAAQFVPLPKRTGSTWLGKVLTETGWLGLAAFVGLLCWMALMGRRLCRSDAPIEDRVLGTVLVGAAAMTGAVAAYGTFLTVKGYAVVFWPLVGLGISAMRDARARSSAAVASP